MRKTLLIFILLFSFTGFSQSDDCEKILSKEIDFNLEDINIEKFRESLSILKNCGLDDGDILAVTNEPILAAYLLQLISEKETVKYQDLYDLALQLQQLEDYELFKHTLLVSDELSKRPADINNWKEDRVLLEQLVFNDNEIEEFHNYLKEHSDPTQTYGVFFIDYRESQLPTESTPESAEPDDWIFQNAGNVYYEDLLNSAIEEGKPLLIYFTGYADVNSRKMEDFVFDTSIKEILKNDFYLVSLYTDDRKSLPKNEQTTSKTDGRLIKTVGGKHADLQQNKFNTNYQPYFVIIDKEGNIIKEQGYTMDSEIFKDFLNLQK